MAKAIWLQDVLTPPPPDVIELTLTRAEAEALLAVTGNIFGLESGPRGQTSNVFWALRDLGVTREKIRSTGRITLEAK
ncbi:hypothetical protein LCGC14_2315460 [marine sediment metagenome]|uniref:Uncharacterized protein n=1 Tax=marine sediment metagenome TaxID=412755 RepID=A0A0F9CJG3_9ZZZZ